ncbi:MAG TPA: tetratricopeptide repeat protein [Gemmatimonadaceae bacterium]|nr:tetratricopeptide repeat protein [Gemmatimonadaceae bacterium]
MFRTARSSRTSLVVAAASLIAMTACKTETDESGGRPSEKTAQPVPVSTSSTTTDTRKPEPPKHELTTVVSDASFKDGEVAFRERRYAEATKVFTDYTASHQTSPYAQYMLGLSAWKSGDLVVAESALTESVKLDPTNVKAQLNLARVLLDAGRPKDAKKYVSKALVLDSSSSDGNRLMGRVHTALKENDEAIVSFRLALKSDPTDSWSMNNLALIMIQQGKYSDAIAPLARATTLTPGVAVFHNNLGIALEHVGQYTLASAEYQGALSADSTYTKALMSLARIKNLKDDPKASVLDLAKLGDEFDKDVRGGKVGVDLVKR